MPPSKKTPMLEQYLSIKDEYPDAILFYRMGDFYEMFYEDAEVASRALEITLTSRNKNDKDPVPMCGVPAKAAKSYLSKLIGQGYKVAICDQVEDPSKAKGLVKRDVVRVITPGMLMEDELPDARANNFILAVCPGRKTVGVSFLDISTGDFKLCEAGDLKRLADEVLRVRPSELLFAESLKNDRLSAEISDTVENASVSWLPDRAFEYGRSRERLLEQFNTVSLEGFGCENMKTAVSAAGAVLFYVRETQKQDVTHLSKIEPYMLDQFLQVDDLSCGNLELVENIRTRGVQGNASVRAGQDGHIHGRTAPAAMDTISACRKGKDSRPAGRRTGGLRGKQYARGGAGKAQVRLRPGASGKQDLHGAMQRQGPYRAEKIHPAASGNRRGGFPVWGRNCTRDTKIRRRYTNWPP